MTVVLKAHAKLTVSLRITGVRDDGYHLLDAEMVTLELADMVTFSEGSGLTMSGPFAAGIEVDESNLVLRALRLAGRDGCCECRWREGGHHRGAKQPMQAGGHGELLM